MKTDARAASTPTPAATGSPRTPGSASARGAERRPCVWAAAEAAAANLAGSGES
jgi:hypothetical protein